MIQKGEKTRAPVGDQKHPGSAKKLRRGERACEVNLSADNLTVCDRSDLSPRQRQIFEYICKYGPISLNGICKAFALARSTVSEHLAVLKSRGIIKKYPKPGVVRVSWLFQAVQS